MKTSVLSWNIWYGKRLHDVITTLKHTDFDIAGLQEITQKNENNTIINTAATISSELHLEYAYAKAFRSNRHTPPYDLGNAVLSKFAVKGYFPHMLSDQDHYDTSSPLRAIETEPRNAIEAIFNHDGVEFHVFSTHLGFSEGLATDMQLYQVEQLLSKLPDKRTILMGDFNSNPESEVIKKMEEKLTNTDPNNHITWKNMKKDGHPASKIDYIFVTPDIKVLDFKVLHSDASDHLPLLAELEI
jgi:endonuclease/exonuclease/phosphatase family metal-dependent hydrolase